MNKLNCNVILNNEENKITVSGLLANELNINISGDVDFTDLVQELTKKIDEEKNIILTIDDEASITDPKNKLILETLKKIFESYKDSIKLLFDDEIE